MQSYKCTAIETETNGIDVKLQLWQDCVYFLESVKIKIDSYNVITR